MADTRRLPTPVAETYAWQMRGSCRGMDSGFFFHPEGERGPAKANREARAKEVCQTCPVMEECRRHALAAHEPYGVWGGLSESERDELIRGHSRRSRLRGWLSGRARGRDRPPRAPPAPACRRPRSRW